jgi:hypothetical protein
VATAQGSGCSHRRELSGRACRRRRSRELGHGPDIVRGGTHEPICQLLFHGMRRPTGDSPACKQRREQVSVEAKRIQQKGCVEFDVGIQFPARLAAGAYASKRIPALPLAPF